MSEITNSKIEKMIYVIRGHKVMMDSDLAQLYEVETRALNQAVKRNKDRFPDDFMFQLIPQEYEVLRSQFVTLNDPSAEARGGRRYGPLVFTENGVTMLSTVLNGQRAIQVNIAIMRIFTKLRSFLMLEKGLTDRMDKLEASTSKMFKIVFERLDDIEDQITPHLPENRRKIGLDDRKKKDKNLTVRIYSSYLTL